jgi:hypothetical protein
LLSILQVVGHPQSLVFGDERPPRRHRSSGHAIENDAGNRFRVGIRQRFRGDGPAEAALPR